jgi:heptosyltransferase-2
MDSGDPQLVVQTSFLGDVVLTTPLIAELSRRGPVDVLTTPIGRSALANNPHIRSIIILDKRAPRHKLRGTLGAMRAVRGPTGKTGYLTAYMAQGSVRSALITMLAGISDRVGFDSSAGRALYTRKIPYREDCHHSERLLRLAIGNERPLSPSDIRPKLFPGPKEKQAVDRVLGANAADGDPFVVLAPGSMWGTKRWPYFPHLARMIARHMRVVVIGGASDHAAGADVLFAAPDRTIDTTGELSILESAELIGRASAIVSNDSAPLHLGSAMNTPTLALFGPTVPDFGFGPLAERHKTAGMDALDCRPCHRHGPQRCPLGHWACMRELSPERVFEILQNLIPPPRRGRDGR